MSDKIAERFFNAGVRIEHLFWIPGICAQAPGEFERFVEDDLCDDNAPLVLEALPFLKGFVERGGIGEDVLSEMAMHRKNGFIFQVATPCPYEVQTDGSYSCSWGNYYTKWMYADTLDEVAASALAFASDVLTAAKAKAIAEARSASA